ncbi:MAG: flagellin FliC, partial [Tepidimonas fonticaldi]|nr:flagellin FliC [Tepidimonas fonticaldi]
MSLSINTNVISLNAQRNTVNNMQSLQTTMARLSSGLRINSAKDDAAGLAIANRMNTQVRGLNVAIRNANDGISLAQVAEGGLSQMTEMLQRMRELAVQAVNSTNTTGAQGDLGKLNEEYVQLRKELSRMTDAVRFNGIAVLNQSSGTNYTFQVGANSGTENRITISGSDITLNGASALTNLYGPSATASALIISANGGNTAIIQA